MRKTQIYTVFIGFAIALSAGQLHAKEKLAQKPSDEVFVCAVTADTPTMYAYTPGEVNLTPLMSWYSEYLPNESSAAEICQQTATKLQASYQQQEAKYLKVETSEENNLVCLVDEEDQNCLTQDSEVLFSVNPNYNAGCVLENKRPIECKASQVRGIYSFEDKPYQPLWWPW